MTHIKCCCEGCFGCNNSKKLSKWVLPAAVLVVATVGNLTVASNPKLVYLNMPDVRPTHDESYLCVAQRLNPSKNEFIGKCVKNSKSKTTTKGMENNNCHATVGFQPNASATKVHHILIYGCAIPGKALRDTPKLVWECGEMNVAKDDPHAEESPYDRGPVCGPGMKTTILFGWALDAPAVELPQQVGFKIGGDSGIDYLVLQVHYGSIATFREGSDITDNSGIALEILSEPHSGITKMAGIYLLLSYGSVSKGVSRHSMECLMQEDKVIHPFRFRTHTHKLGTRVAGYLKPRNDPRKSLLIGEHNPQEPQMFYPVDDPEMTINRGDRIHAFCDYNNTHDHIVYIGATGNDEMCNFYLMYWTDGELLENYECMQYNT